MEAVHEPKKNMFILLILGGVAALCRISFIVTLLVLDILP